ncbi:MAG: electron transport complex subunit RsxC [Marinobacter sp.]|nr:electron transport complex subunit RsxC [Marinobacter sp.]
MTALWQFPGGIHPDENKHQSSARAIREAGLPPALILPLQQHIGAPAQTRVDVGQHVLKGDCLADAQGPMGVPVHAPTSGTIEAISQQPVPHPSGLSDWCVTLVPDGEDRWGARHPISDYPQRERAEILAAIRQAGIVGLGGAGFPTSVKLQPPKQDTITTLILNAAECEPYITADDRLMRERAPDIVAGIEIMMWLVRPERCLIGIEDNKPEAIAALREATRGSTAEVVVIPTRYPSGGEKQLIQILTGREVPHGGIPADIGVICQNVGTAAAVARAIHQGEPLISRITTVTGNAVDYAGNFEVLLGTPVDYLLSLAGVHDEGVRRLVHGGPMMGFTLPDAGVPVVKSTNCIIAAGEGELAEPSVEQPCIRCGACAEACPMELLPQQLFWTSKSGEFDKAEHLNLFDCIECGACAYVCPSSIPLVQYYRYAKGEVRNQRAEQLKADQARQRFEARQARLEREQAEKEARRKERAKAAARSASEPGEADDAKAARAAAVRDAVARKQQATASQPDHNEPAGAASPANTGGPPGEPAGPPIDLADLEKQLAQARNKLNTMAGMLKEARAAGTDNVDKLERAVAKNRDRVIRAEQALADAHTRVDATPTSTD